MKSRLWIVVGILGVGIVWCRQAPNLPMLKIKGVYGHPRSLWERGYTLKELGINAVFTGSGGVDRELIDRCGKEGAEVFAEFATFRGDYRLKDWPGIAPVGADGKPIPKTDRFLGACPSNPEFNAYLLEKLTQLISTHDISGVILDYLHFHCDFETPIRNLIFDESCFEPNYLGSFEKSSGLTLPEGTTAAQAGWIL